MDTKLCLNCAAPVLAAPRSRSIKKFCCKQCREKHWVSNNRDRLNQTVRKYRARRYREEGLWRDEGPKAAALKLWMAELKSAPCSDCGACFPVCCMDFDHRDDTTKAYNVGSMFAHHYSRELIQSEIDKCDLVCSNCHRIRTRDRRTGSGRHAAKHDLPQPKHHD